MPNSRNAASTSMASGRPTSEALTRLRAGEITLDEYLDSRVEKALARLRGFLSGEDLEVIRGNLREQFAADPVLVTFVNRLTSGNKSE